MNPTPIRLLLAASACFLLGPPGHTSDAQYPSSTPDPGLRAQPIRRPPPPSGAPSPARPRPPALLDAEGTSYSPEDVRLGFLPVLRGFRRSGGGLVRIWSGAPSGFLVPGIDTPLPEPPSPPDPEPPSPPNPNPDPNPKPYPPDPQDVPAPLPILGLIAAFIASRKLRRRLHQ